MKMDIRKEFGVVPAEIFWVQLPKRRSHGSPEHNGGIMSYLAWNTLGSPWRSWRNGLSTILNLLPPATGRIWWIWSIVMPTAILMWFSLIFVHQPEGQSAVVSTSLDFWDRHNNFLHFRLHFLSLLACFCSVSPILPSLFIHFLLFFAVYFRTRQDQLCSILIFLSLSKMTVSKVIDVSKSLRTK